MKKVLVIVIIQMFTCMAGINNVSAQFVVKSLALVRNNPELIRYAISEEYATNKNASSSIIPVAEERTHPRTARKQFKGNKAGYRLLKANFKAVGNFNKKFKDVPNANWRAENDLIIASFTTDEVKINVVYDNAGRWFHTLRYYPESKIPAEVVAAAKYDYRNATVRIGIRIQEGDLDFFVVQMEDRTTYKQVAVFEGEATLIKEIAKGN